MIGFICTYKVPIFLAFKSLLFKIELTVKLPFKIDGTLKKKKNETLFFRPFLKKTTTLFGLNEIFSNYLYFALFESFLQMYLRCLDPEILSQKVDVS